MERESTNDLRPKPRACAAEYDWFQLLCRVLSAAPHSHAKPTLSHRSCRLQHAGR